MPASVALTLAACSGGAGRDPGSTGGGASPATTGATTNAATTTDSLQGAYQPEGDVTQGEFRALAFYGSDGYFAYKNGCTDDCRSQGTYTYDGVKTLTLHDEATGTDEDVDFEQQSGGGSLAGQSHPLDGIIFASDAGPLVSPIAATVNGILMALDVTNNVVGTICDPSSSSTPTDGVNAVLDCAEQGNVVGSYNADGSCSCGDKLPDTFDLRNAIKESFMGAGDLDGTAQVDPSTLPLGVKAFYDWNTTQGNGFFGPVMNAFATTYAVPGANQTVYVVGATETDGAPYWQFLTMSGALVTSSDQPPGKGIRWN